MKKIYYIYLGLKSFFLKMLGLGIIFITFNSIFIHFPVRSHNYDNLWLKAILVIVGIWITNKGLSASDVINKWKFPKKFTEYHIHYMNKNNELSKIFVSDIKYNAEIDAINISAISSKGYIQKIPIKAIEEIILSPFNSTYPKQDIAELIDRRFKS